MSSKKDKKSKKGEECCEEIVAVPEKIEVKTTGIPYVLFLILLLLILSFNKGQILTAIKAFFASEIFVPDEIPAD